MLLSKTMINKLISLILFTLILFNLSGCSLIRMGQESVEKVKTSTSHGYQNGIEPDSIRNIKDYIVDENDFVIIAEDNYRTLYKARNESNLGRFSRLTDLVDYCEDIKGSVKFGKQFGASLTREYDTIDFEFSSIKSDYRKNRLRGYGGWMKCSDSEDNFEIKRKGSSKYFLITHEKEQLQGYSLRWYIDYFNLDELDLNTQNIGIWSYSTLVQLAGVCQYNGGKVMIFNRYTNKISMDLDSYLLQQLDPLNGKKGYLLASGDFACQDSKTEDFIFEISYSKKYQKLLYTKRQ